MPTITPHVPQHGGAYPRNDYASRRLAHGGVHHAAYTQSVSQPLPGGPYWGTPATPSLHPHSYGARGQRPLLAATSSRTLPNASVQTSRQPYNDDLWHQFMNDALFSPAPSVGGAANLPAAGYDVNGYPYPTPGGYAHGGWDAQTTQNSAPQQYHHGWCSTQGGGSSSNSTHGA
ncbi:hypothetical protein L226DRAFT_109878 [Lentinus tigrinus ALCF2SS1-7]|uniref:Uncharacterized protein n=1 Tax=Lentinus tigrinus ALCF2SS1-6 TaxID=1328759 RepID=A0A5C2S5G4_9APHY|nr:hypothetical protein L227DRAFT_169361 [Lentinus tigrinus ALCF2SS1-6]RPD73396.1 hypothetical protein L226DRAFT_109878 [Lentinus tigrinus ALCF2SS1-7]